MLICGRQRRTIACRGDSIKDQVLVGVDVVGNMTRNIGRHWILLSRWSPKL